MFLYLAFLNIHRWLNVANITPYGPDDGSVEPKLYRVNFTINLSFHLDYLVINFSWYACLCVCKAIDLTTQTMLTGQPRLLVSNKIFPAQIQNKFIEINWTWLFS